MIFSNGLSINSHSVICDKTRKSGICRSSDRALSRARDKLIHRTSPCSLTKKYAQQPSIRRQNQRRDNPVRGWHRCMRRKVQRCGKVASPGMMHLIERTFEYIGQDCVVNCPRLCVDRRHTDYFGLVGTWDLWGPGCNLPVPQATFFAVQFLRGYLLYTSAHFSFIL